MAETTEFRVQLKGIKLPAKARQAIESRIREAAMVELARLDMRGELTYSKLRLGPEIAGFIAAARLAAKA